MAYTDTDVMMRPGGMGGMGFGGQRPEDFDPSQLPEDFDPNMIPEGLEAPEGEQRGERPQMPEGEMPTMPEGFDPGQMKEMPEGFEPGQMPEGMEVPEGGFGGLGEFTAAEPGEANAQFYMQDKVNFFSGLTSV